MSNSRKKVNTYNRADGRRNKMLVSRERHRLVQRVNEDSSFGSYYRVEQELNVPRSSIRYWVIKSSDPHFHKGSCGGKRSGTFADWEKSVLHQYIVEFLDVHPHSNLQVIAKELTLCFYRNVSVKVIYFSDNFFSVSHLIS